MKIKDIPVGIFIAQNNRLQLSNKAFCDMMGYKLEEIIGKEIKKIIAPEDMERLQKFLSLSKKKTAQAQFDLSLMHKDRKRRINVKICKDLAKYKGEKICIGTVMELNSIEKALENFLSEFDKSYSFFEESKNAMYITSVNGKVLDANPAIAELFGYDKKEDFIGTNVKKHYVDLEDREAFKKAMEEIGFVKDYELKLKNKKGKIMDVSITANALKNDAGKTIAYRGTIRDTTEHKRIEERIRELQKMEALGRLAGGIAHDFNNLLTIILGNSELLLEKIKPEDPDYEKLRAIFETAEKASSLTSQLLTFSRGKVPVESNFNPNTLIQKISKFIKRVIGEDVHLKLNLSPEVEFVKSDPIQLEQVILNLAINARDAMPEGGTLTILTEPAELKPEDCRVNPEAVPGKYAVISVCDSGAGIPPEILDRIFEPFFSTKETGSGLGLSIVYGIVKQAGGQILVDSETGKGTTFRIYLPASREKENSLSTKDKREEKITHEGKGKIMVIEDDLSVLDFIKDLLELYGYEVITASSGEEAISKAEESKGEFDILISDIILPQKSGVEAVKEILKVSPKIKIIFISGYPAHRISQILEFKDADFLPKPFTPSMLIEKIKKTQKAN